MLGINDPTCRSYFYSRVKGTCGPTMLTRYIIIIIIDIIITFVFSFLLTYIYIVLIILLLLIMTMIDVIIG